VQRLNGLIVGKGKPQARVKQCINVASLKQTHHFIGSKGINGATDDGNQLTNNYIMCKVLQVIRFMKQQ